MIRDTPPFSVVILAVLSVLFPLMGESSSAGPAPSVESSTAKREKEKPPPNRASSEESEAEFKCGAVHRRIPASCNRRFWEPLGRAFYSRWTRETPNNDTPKATISGPGCTFICDQSAKAATYDCLLPAVPLPPESAVRPIMVT